MYLHCFATLTHLWTVQGKLTREEWIEKFGNDDMFDAYDADHNGTLSPEEWASGVTNQQLCNHRFSLSFTVQTLHRCKAREGLYGCRH